MKKIPTIFLRDASNPKCVTRNITPGCEWVFAGEGVPTRKWDGMAMLIKNGRLFKRYDAKKGKKPPENFVPAQEPDENTGHHPGWVPVGEGPEDAVARLAIISGDGDGTYELLHPRYQGRDSAHINPENVDRPLLIRHGIDKIAFSHRSFDELNTFLSTAAIEGIVWYHPDGRMAKIKARDFGHTRK